VPDRATTTSSRMNDAASCNELTFPTSGMQKGTRNHISPTSPELLPVIKLTTENFNLFPQFVTKFTGFRAHPSNEAATRGSSVSSQR
jgi:hypothetical protein